MKPSAEVLRQRLEDERRDRMERRIEELINLTKLVTFGLLGVFIAVQVFREIFPTV